MNLSIYLQFNKYLKLKLLRGFVVLLQIVFLFNYYSAYADTQCLVVADQHSSGDFCLDKATETTWFLSQKSRKPKHWWAVPIHRKSEFDTAHQLTQDPTGDDSRMTTVEHLGLGQELSDADLITAAEPSIAAQKGFPIGSQVLRKLRTAYKAQSTLQGEVIAYFLNGKVLVDFKSSYGEMGSAPAPCEKYRGNLVLVSTTDLYREKDLKSSKGKWFRPCRIHKKYLHQADQPKESEINQSGQKGPAEEWIPAAIVRIFQKPHRKNRYAEVVYTDRSGKINATILPITKLKWTEI